MFYNDLERIVVSNSSGIGTRIIPLPKKRDIFLVAVRVSVGGDNGYLGLYSRYGQTAYPKMVDIIKNDRYTVTPNGSDSLKLTIISGDAYVNSSSAVELLGF